MSVATEEGEAGDEGAAMGGAGDRGGAVGPLGSHQLVAEELMEQFRNEDLESRLSGGGGSPESQDSTESISREEKLLEEMLRLKLTVGSASAMLPPKQRIKLYQPRSKLEQFEDILIESQLLEQALPDLAGSPLDYDKFELEASLGGLGLDGGITDFDASDAIFAEPEAGTPDDRPEADQEDAACQCDSCQERGQLVAEMAEETRRLQAAWLQLRDDFRCVYRLVLEGAWPDSNRPKPGLEGMAESVHQLVWRDPHQLYQRLEAQLKDFVLELRQRLVELLQKQAKDPNLAQQFIQSLLAGHDKLCEAARIVAPVLADLEINHLRRFSLTWELLSKHLYQLVVYTDPLIQNNLPIFISQLRALYPNKENEDKYTELVRGYLDFDVEMENVGVFWSGTEALLLEYSQEQQRLREKQKMLKSDWERFKQQRKQIETSLMEKPPAGGGEEVTELVPGEEHFGLGPECTAAGRPCECNVCTAPLHNGHQEPGAPLFPPETAATPCSALYPHLYNLPATTATSTTSTTSTSSTSGQLPGVVSSVASLSAALSSALQLTTAQAATTPSPAPTASPPPSPRPAPPSCRPAAPPSALPGVLTVPGYQVEADGNDGIRVTAVPEPTTPPARPSTPPARPSSLQLEPAAPSAASSVSSSTGSDDKRPSAAPAKPAPAAAKPLPTTCNHKHNNANAKELKKMMGHDCGKPKPGARKSKSTSSVRDDGGDGGESTEELSEDSSPEDSCSSSASGDKHCACCYCEVFGHGGPSVAPVSRNYPEMRERLRLLLSKKKRGHRAAGGSCPGAGVSHPAPAAKPAPAPAPPRAAQAPPQAAPRPQPAPPRPAPAPQTRPAPAPAAPPLARPAVARPHSLSSHSPSPVPVKVKDILAKKGVDEVLEYIEGNKNLDGNDKKRLKKERQKQQRLEELRAKQEEERKRKAAEESARRAREEEERMKKDLEDKAFKKSKKKAAQKAKKLAAGGPGDSPCPETPDNEPENLLDLENMRLKHIREQKELLEKQKQQLIEQQRKLDEQLTMKIGERNAANAAVSAAEAAKANLSRKATKKAAKAASPAPTMSLGPGPQVTITPMGGAGYTSAPGYYPAPPAAAPPPPYYPGYGQQQGYQQHMGYQQQFGAGGPSGFPGPQGGYPGAQGGYPGAQGGYPGAPGGYPGAQGGPSGYPGAPGGPSSYQPQPARPAPPPAPKSDQPMVTIKRVMRPDSSEPTVTISVKKEEDGSRGEGAGRGQAAGGQGGQDKVLFTLVNGQVMKTANAPDNLIPGAKPMPQELAKRLMPEEGGEAKLSKKQRKKAAGGRSGREGEAVASPGLHRAGPVAATLPPGGQVDFEKLRLPDGVSISKISGPVPERRYFPCKEAPGPGPPPPAAPWAPAPYPGPAQPYQAGYPSFPAPPAPNSNVIVVDTNSLDEKDEKLSKKAKKKAKAKALAPGAPAAAPGPWAPPAGPPAAGRPKEWTPAQYGGYVPPATGGSGGQVLIKSVNGKVVITPVPGTGGPEPAKTANPSPAPAPKRVSPAPQRAPAPAPAPAPSVKRPLAPTAPPRAAAPARVPPPQLHGSSNGNNNIENQAPNEEMTNGNHGTAEEEKRNKKNKAKKRNPDEKLEEINSIFAPRESGDSGDMDPADREIEQFKQFCLDSRPAQNRAKVSFDVRNIAFKKKT